jgi:hypothetical protein
MPRVKPIDRGRKLLPIDLSVQFLPGATSNRGNFPKDIFCAAKPAFGDRACPTDGSDRGFASLELSNRIRYASVCRGDRFKCEDACES